MFETVKANLLRIQEEIAPYKPNIIAVTKYFGTDAVIAAYQAGLRDFGESRALEAIDKINQLPEEIRKNSHFHFIGHLQGNKVKKVVKYFKFIHSVDSLKLAQHISAEALAEGKVQKIFLQLNIAGEEQKFGYSKETLLKDFEDIRNLGGVDVAGLMCMTPLNAPDNELEKLFREAEQTRKSLADKFDCKLPELSMGMSQDYKLAAMNGATMLRIGRKLFS